MLEEILMFREAVIPMIIVPSIDAQLKDDKLMAELHYLTYGVEEHLVPFDPIVFVRWAPLSDRVTLWEVVIAAQGAE